MLLFLYIWFIVKKKNQILQIDLSIGYKLKKKPLFINLTQEKTIIGKKQGLPCLRAENQPTKVKVFQHSRSRTFNVTWKSVFRIVMWNKLHFFNHATQNKYFSWRILFIFYLTKSKFIIFFVHSLELRCLKKKQDFFFFFFFKNNLNLVVGQLWQYFSRYVSLLISLDPIK